jgi:hypothetical protein
MSVHAVNAIMTVSRRDSMIMSANSGKSKRPSPGPRRRNFSDVHRSMPQRSASGMNSEMRSSLPMPREMFPAGHIFREQDVSRPEADLLAAVELDFTLTAQRDHARRGAGCQSWK